MITICVTYYRSLALANLAACLYSIARQNMSGVSSVVLVDNNTDDRADEIQAVVDAAHLSVPVDFLSIKHGDSSKTHSWSTNLAVQHAETPLVLFTRADYILDFRLLKRFAEIFESRPLDWNGFVTSDVYHLAVDVGVCETRSWRTEGAHVLRDLPGAQTDYAKIDTGTWMAQKETFDRVGGLDESLTAWGHAQTDFQYRLHESGTEFVRIPETLFYHPIHAGERDLELAHQQLREKGGDLREMWKRHEGARVY